MIKRIFVSLTLMLSMLILNKDNRWKFNPVQYDNNNRVLYYSKLPGMLISDIPIDDLKSFHVPLYNFYREYNGFDYQIKILNVLLDNISYFFSNKEKLLKYYWASKLLNSCNFSEISIYLFNKLPKDLTREEERFILYIMHNRIYDLRNIDENMKYFTNKYKNMVDKIISRNKIQEIYDSSNLIAKYE